MQTGPFPLFLALAIGALLSLLWAGFAIWILVLVMRRPELDPQQTDGRATSRTH